MSFFRTQRAQVLRSKMCGSSDINVCNAFRRLGDMTFNERVMSPPSAPTILSNVVSGTSVTLSFTPPPDDNNTIINYEYSLDGGSNFTPFSPAVTTSPVIITGLTLGTTYSVVLRAVNIIGSGAGSVPLSIVAPTIPGAPTALTYTTSGTSATISFTPGSTGGSAITNYEYSTNGGTSFTAFSPADTASPVTINGLTNGTTYSVKLRAVNIMGHSAASSTLSVAIPAVVPFAPSSLTSSGVGTKSFNLSFTPGSTGGSAITNYQYSVDGGATFTAFSPAVTSSPVTISGLSNGTTYSVVLKPVNAVGSGASSASLSVTTAKIEGSLQFNGSNSLSLSPGAAIGTGAYTVECWFYNNNNWNTTASFQIGLLGFGIHSELNALAVFFNNDRTITTDKNGGGWQPSYSFPSAITLNAWHHFVLVRNSAQIETVFIDGVKASSAAGLLNPTNGHQTNIANYAGVSDQIGSFYHGNWTGYLANFRIVVGHAVYDPTAASITVPTGALTNITDTKYLMVGDTVTDDGSATQMVTNSGGVTLSANMVPL